MELHEKLSALKDTQPKRIKETRDFFVEPWDCQVSIKKVTLNDMISSEAAAYDIADDGTKRFSEEIRKGVIVLLGVVDLHPLRDKEFIFNEPSGIVSSLFKEIMEFSGFGTSIEAVLKEKKKD